MVMVLQSVGAFQQTQKTIQELKSVQLMNNFIQIKTTPYIQHA